MDIFERIFAHNEQWIAEKLALDPDFFQKLNEGQHPEILYIGCSDSRVTAEDMMGAQPGEVFVHRNVANQVLPTDNNANAVIQYAVEYLKVKHIVVCGHYGCGGVNAAMNPSDMGQLNSWLQSLRDVYRYHMDELEAIADSDTRFKRLVQLNVIEQCINVVKTDHVQRSWYATGYPKVHGWVFCIDTGRIIDMELDMPQVFASIRKIYDLKPQA